MIAVDANGADRGPRAVAEGVARSKVACVVFGPAGELDACAGAAEIVDAPEYITGDEEPALAVRSRPAASIVQAADAVASGRASALVSAGATGAVLAAALLRIKRLRGVHRPALAVVLPTLERPSVLVDAGANADVRPEHLVQFAYLGACFARACLGVERPRVGLLSVGEERAKGSADVLEAHARLAERAEAGERAFDFHGNVEGFDVPRATVDVVVTDGFTGNVALKVMESTAAELGRAIRREIAAGPLARFGGLLVRGRLRRLRERIDPERIGGAILLGLRRPVIVAHGSFGPEGIASAVRLAQRAVDERMVERTADALASAGVLRSAAGASVAAK